MKIRENINLASLTTMHISCNARFLLEINSPEEIPAAINFAKEKKLPWFVLGGGSNIIARKEFNGVIIQNKIKGFREIFSDKNSAAYQIGAGENLDQTIAKFVDLGLSGMEFLSLIPGVVGATPVQNVGAYGADISQVMTKLTAFNTETNEFEILKNADCNFSYRNSIFKSRENRKYIIANITVKLSRKNPQPPFYGSLEKYCSDNKITKFTPKNIRSAVIAIREEKLPDPAKIPSAGSFFKNPIISEKFAKNFLAKNPSAPHFPMPENEVKLAAGWLMDQTNLKGFEKFGFKIYPKNALVITNVEPTNTAENLAKFRLEIVKKVHEKFNITLEQEPENL